MSILIGILSVAILLLLNSIGIAVSLRFREGLKGAYIFYVVWGLFVVYGTIIRWRLAWRVARIIAGVSAILSVSLAIILFIGALCAIGIGVAQDASPVWMTGAVVLVGANYYVIWRSFNHSTALNYFRLVCPRCGIVTHKGSNMLFCRAQCKSCGKIW
jgi:hypothetical protein